MAVCRLDAWATCARYSFVTVDEVDIETDPL